MPASTKIHIDDVRIQEIKELAPPAHVLREFPATPRAATVAYEARQSIHRILFGADDRLLVVIGPCSIHDPAAAMEYASRLKAEADRLKDDLLIFMRVYFEKPRTTVGWKGLINDPGLDNSYRINDGVRLARKLLWEINELGLPAATEFLDWLWTDEAQQIWQEQGYRSVNPQLLDKEKYPVPPGLFTIEEFGGWDAVVSEFFEDKTGSIFKIVQDLGISTE